MCSYFRCGQCCRWRGYVYASEEGAERSAANLADNSSGSVGWIDDMGVVMLAIASVPIAVAGWIGRRCYVAVKVLGNVG